MAEATSLTPPSLSMNRNGVIVKVAHICSDSTMINLVNNIGTKDT